MENLVANGPVGIVCALREEVVGQCADIVVPYLAVFRKMIAVKMSEGIGIYVKLTPVRRSLGTVKRVTEFIVELLSCSGNRFSPTTKPPQHAGAFLW